MGDLEAAEQAALEADGPMLTNWWPARGPIDPYASPVWEAPSPVFLRRERDSELHPIAPLPEGLAFTQRILGPRRRVELKERVVMRQSYRTKPVKKLALSVGGHIATIASLTIDQAMHLAFWTDDWQQGHVADGVLESVVEQNSFLTVRLDYPLGAAADVRIQPVTRTWKRPGEEEETQRDLNVSALLWQLAQAYAQIYREETEDIAAGRPGRWQIWGHTLRDLVFEGLTIEPYKGLAHVDIGS